MDHVHCGPATDVRGIFDLPEDESGDGELLDGEWIHSRLPEQACNDIATQLFLDLFRFSESLRLDGSCPQIGKVQGAPLVAIEILAESDSAPTVDSKIEKYFQNGAEEVWVFYPNTRRVLTYFAGRDEVEIGREYIRSRILSEVKSIPLATIW